MSLAGASLRTGAALAGRPAAKAAFPALLPSAPGALFQAPSSLVRAPGPRCPRGASQVVHYKEEEAGEGAEAPAADPFARHVVVAVDDSEDAAYEVEWAMKNLYHEGDCFHIVHCVPASVGSATITDMPNGHVMYMPSPDAAELAQVTDRVAHHISAHLGDVLDNTEVPYKIEVLYENDIDGHSVGDLICSKAKQLDAAALVLASHRKSKVAEFFLGSITNYCVHRSERPVIVLHNPQHPAGLSWLHMPWDAEPSTTAPAVEPKTGRTILVAVDESTKSDEMLVWALDNLYREGDKLRLVHVVPALPMTPIYGAGANGLVYLTDPAAPDVDTVMEAARKTFDERFDGFLTERNIAHELQIVPECTAEPLNSVGRAVCQCADAVDAELVVMGAQGKAPVEELLLGSVSSYCAHNLQKPLIVLH